MTDAEYMAQALLLAKKGLYTTTPNPRVGCVIVQAGQVIGQGWHQRAGEPHAEAYALQEAGEKARGATAYVTLEPCSHLGRTPPCADALIQAGVARVVVAMQDPNPLVAGRGISRLRAAGIVVDLGLLEAEAQALNLGFVARMTRNRPWVRVKIASSLDGKTALLNGKSQWITGTAAREDVQHWRAQSCVVLTGSGTAWMDGAKLTARNPSVTRQPLRVLVDSALRVPLDAPIYQQAAPLLVAHTQPRRLSPNAQNEWLVCGTEKSKVDLPLLLQTLAARGCNEVLVEAGAGLNGALLQQGLVDELILYQAPILLGDQGFGLFALPALTEMQAQRRCQLIEQKWFAQDQCLRFALGDALKKSE